MSGEWTDLIVLAVSMATTALILWDFWSGGAWSGHRHRPPAEADRQSFRRIPARRGRGVL